MSPYRLACARLIEHFLMHVEDEYGAYLADMDPAHPKQLEPEDVRPMIVKWAEQLKEGTGG